MVINKFEYLRETERATNILSYHINKASVAYMSLLKLELYLVQREKLYYSEEHFEEQLSIIVDNIELINSKMLELREFCYVDIKRVIPYISALDDREEEKSIEFIKNLSLLKRVMINENERLTLQEKQIIIEGMEANKRIREFFHQGSSILNLSIPVRAKNLIRIQQNGKLSYVNEILSDITFAYNNLERFRREVTLVRYLNDVIDEKYYHPKTFNVMELSYFVDFYKEKGREYYYAGHSCFIDVRYEALSNASCYSDFGKIKEVFEVILNNAFEELALINFEEMKKREDDNFFVSLFSSKRKYEVNISVDWLCPNKQHGIIVTISDNGRGIDDIEKAYIPFSTTKSLFGGTGLGLDIARRICEFLNIKIEVKSSSDGTSFKFTIPSMEETMELAWKEGEDDECSKIINKLSTHKLAIPNKAGEEGVKQFEQIVNHYTSCAS